MRTKDCLSGCGGTWPAISDTKGLPFHQRDCPSDEAAHVRGVQHDALLRHTAERRAKTLAAIRRGVCTCSNSNEFHGCDVAAQRVLTSLEQMWHDDEAFS